MRFTSERMSIGTDPSVRRCTHGVAVGFVLNIDRAPMARPFCDRDDCAREARRFARGCDVASGVIFGSNAVPAALQ